ncbi:hypothetical protein HK097_007920 [Rhizophlyctis rosea]|uniref:SAM domain-containing protein n=1 Tax=Rhizophlyctis rosea TaxID=64517 RepID=A0AAD5SE38_9FUNG|nr:hypothetical protein HK097_007920 [Rhizophlyctis rosea]
MDPHAQITSVTFAYPVTTYDGIESGTASLQAQVTDLVRQQCEEVAQQHGCNVAFSTPEPVFTRQQGKYEFNYALSVTGTPGQVQAARGALLRNNPTQIMLTVKVHRPLMLNENGEMRASVKRKLDDVMKSTRTQITCVGQSQTYDKPARMQHHPSHRHFHTPPPGFMSSGNVSPDVSSEVDSMDVEIVGGADAVERARMKCLVLFDELSGLAHETIELDPQMQIIAAGRKRCILDSLMHDTMTNIYLPSPFAGMQTLRGPIGQGGDGNDPDRYPYTVHITGDPVGVAHARNSLLNWAGTRTQLLKSKSILCLPRKLDWMLINCKDQIKKIMTDNACFVSIPLMGSNSNILTVVGDDEVYIERALRAVNLMCCDFYAAVIEITPPQSRAPSPIVFPSLPVLNSHLGRITQSSRSEIIFGRNLFEIYGLEAAVKASFMRVAELEFVRAAPVRSTKIQLETAMEHREFINGKKSGKVNKIVKSSGSEVKFEGRYNEYNMLVDLWNAYPSKALEGLALLEDELPAEISFYVPEAYHKRIIGVGGKNIQRIMKKHGVYVKFSNAEEHALMGGYFENQDNVIARTPSKNSANLDNLKAEVTELVHFGGGVLGRGEVTTSVLVPRHLHRVVVGPRGGNMRELEAMTKVKFVFPEKEEGRDEITLSGPEPQVQAARHKLQDLIPDVYSVHLPATTMAAFALRSPEFTEVVFRLHQEFTVEIYVYSPPPDEPQPAECAIWLYVPRGSSAWEGAKKVLVEWLNAKQVPMQVPTGVPRSGSYANLTPQRSYDSFQHFNSKLLASVTAGGETQPPVLAASYSLFHDGVAGLSFDLQRTAKPSQSVPNLRQLFEDVRISPTPHVNGVGGEALKRSMSEMSDQGGIGRGSGGNILGNTLAATAGVPFGLRGGTGADGWGNGMFQRAGSADTVFTRYPHQHSHSQHSQSSHYVPDDEEITSPMDDSLLGGLGSALSPHDDELPSPTGDVRVPTAKFRGMSLSRSMPNVEDDGTSGSGKGSPPKGRSGLAEELQSVDADAEDTGDLIPFGEEMIEQLFLMEAQNSKDMNQIRHLLRWLDLDKLYDMFVEQEVDFPTLLTLTDTDLRDELGIRTFGARKKMMNAIRQCKASQAFRRFQMMHQARQAEQSHHQHGDSSSMEAPGTVETEGRSSSGSSTGSVGTGRGRVGESPRAIARPVPVGSGSAKESPQMNGRPGTPGHGALGQPDYLPMPGYHQAGHHHVQFGSLPMKGFGE